MAVSHSDIASLRWQLCLGTAADKLVALLHIPADITTTASFQILFNSSFTSMLVH
jgi:hypothetical protein